MALAFVAREFHVFANQWPAKRRAALVHVSISLGIFLGFLYFLLFRWYPLPYFQTDGGWQGLRIMFAVDVVLGPLLTFIIFNPAKSRREIIFDLSLIALVQISALAWGVRTVHRERPAAVILWDGGFTTVPALYYPHEDLAKLAGFDKRIPPVIYEHAPGDDEIFKVIRLANQGVPRSAQLFLYEPLDKGLAEAFRRAADFETRITVKRPELKAEFARVRAKYGEDVGFLPFQGRYGKAIFVLSRKGEILDSLPRK